MDTDEDIIETIQRHLQNDGISFTPEQISETLTYLSNVSEALIIVNLPLNVFDESNTKLKFEKFFRDIDELCCISYLKSFRRVRVDMSSSDKAIISKIRFNEVMEKAIEVLLDIDNDLDQDIRCFFAQDLQLSINTETHLQVPLPDKQFLISPPSSPPVGWEPQPEGSPVINYDLLAALASLAPGESHELHKSLDSSQPSILITPCAAPSPRQFKFDYQSDEP